MTDIQHKYAHKSTHDTLNYLILKQDLIYVYVYMYEIKPYKYSAKYLTQYI